MTYAPWIQEADRLLSSARVCSRPPSKPEEAGKHRAEAQIAALLAAAESNYPVAAAIDRLTGQLEQTNTRIDALTRELRRANDADENDRPALRYLTDLVSALAVKARAVAPRNGSRFTDD